MYISRKLKEELKEKYPIGARVELVIMKDNMAPKPGTLGTVRGIDDIGSILVNWDNGSSLNVLHKTDQIKVL